MSTFIGKPCKFGHTERYTRNGACAECSRRNTRRWDNLHPKAALERRKRFKLKNPDWMKNWNKENKERMRSLQLKWVKKNPDRVREIDRKWSKNNKEAVATKARNKRAKLRMAGGKHTKVDILEIKILQKNRCAYCKSKLTSKYHVDHIVAIANGGSNARSNLQILCEPCNRSKGAKDPIEFSRLNGLLI